MTGSCFEGDMESSEIYRLVWMVLRSVSDRYFYRDCTDYAGSYDDSYIIHIHSAGAGIE